MKAETIVAVLFLVTSIDLSDSNEAIVMLSSSVAEVDTAVDTELPVSPSSPSAVAEEDDEDEDDSVLSLFLVLMISSFSEDEDDKYRDVVVGVV